jgi:hypothetical protein
MPLSVLSALARLDVDPWEEAAKLSELPKDTAAQRLASFIVRLPGGRWTQADFGSTSEGTLHERERQRDSHGLEHGGAIALQLALPDTRRHRGLRK